jgi:UDP-N-acetylmuramyl tripeptide synthase
MDGTRIRVAAFTNFTQDHLDYHGSMEAYWEAKAELFRWPGLQAAVVNIDDARGRRAAGRATAGGSARPVDLLLRARGAPAGADIGYGDEGLRFVIAEGAERTCCRPR